MSVFIHKHKKKSQAPSKIWWLFGVVIFAVCVLIQMPASWIVQKYAPNNPYVQQVSGNIWQGSAIITIPITHQTNTTNISSSVGWQWQPWQLFLGKMAADVTLTSGQTSLSGQLKLGLNSWQANQLSGRISSDTLSSILDWKVPDAPISVNALSLSYQDGKGIVDADGQLTWTGGTMGYPTAGKVFNINLPSMRADISDTKKGEQSFLKADLLDAQSKRLGELLMDQNQMLDINLTQRLLEHMPEYNGQAPQDTVVVSVRQPLFSNTSATNFENGE